MVVVGAADLSGARSPRAVAPVLRPAGPADADALFAVHRRSVEAFCAGAYPAAHLAAWFVGRSASMYGPALQAGRIWLAASDTRVLGFVEAVPGEVTLLFVHPQASGQAVGSQLLARGIALAQGGRPMPVTVVSTDNAVSFYRRHGFQAVEATHFVRGDPPLHYPVLRMVRPGAPPDPPA